jgi:hypothetical protein
VQGCNTDAVRALLGGEELSDANLLAHLGIIEQRTNEVLQVRWLHASWQPQKLPTDIVCTADDTDSGQALDTADAHMHWLVVLDTLQAHALSKPNHPALAELLHAQPVVTAPGHRIVIEPPSTLEPLGGAAGPGQPAGSTYQPGLGYGSASLGLLDQQQLLGDAGGAVEEQQPDDVLPLTRTQLQAKVGADVVH